jgi:hypothetical protein
MAGGKRKYDDIHMTPDVSYIRNPDVAHEESDVAVGPIAKFVVGLAVFLAVTVALMWLLFNFLERRAVQSERRPSPLARTGQESLPPAPRLQSAPGFVLDERDDPEGVLKPVRRNLELREPQAEYKELLKVWEHELAEYGWADQATGAVRIPIKEAMSRYAQQQAGKQTPPSQQQQQPPAQQGQQTATPASSGHAPEQRNH